MTNATANETFNILSFNRITYNEFYASNVNVDPREDYSSIGSLGNVQAFDCLHWV